MKQEEKSNLVVRRGQPFKLIITLNKPYNENDEITFMFSCSGKILIIYNIIALPEYKFNVRFW